MALAEWLTFRLTGAGYKVWCDRVKLLGGESYPREIDDAIKSRAFRLLALLSHHSLSKPNPVKERTLALSIARERGIDFLIPLNLGLRPAELDWMTSDLIFIDFSRNWATGLSQLLKALRAADAPCPLPDGRDKVAASVIPPELTRPEQETILSNVFPVTRVPEVVSTFRSRHPLSSGDFDLLRREWPCYKIDPSTYLAFFSPPESLNSRFGFEGAGQALWSANQRIHGVRSRDVVSSLIFNSVMVRCLQRGLVFNEQRKWLHFPKGLVEGDRLSFIGCDGKKHWVYAAGERSFFSPGKEKEKYQHNLAPAISVRRDLGDGFVVCLNVRVHIGDPDGRTLPPDKARSRRKRVTHDWWNWQWMNRHLAIMQHVSEGQDEIVIGDEPKEQLIIAAMPVSFVSPISLGEGEIDRRREGRKLIALGGLDDTGGMAHET
jgi:hypothetical protein